MKYTDRQKQLAQRAKDISGQIESTRWDLAYLAVEAEAEGVEKWAEIISGVCRRSPSTVYEWRRAEVLRNSVSGSFRLSISFWVTAANGITEDNAQERMAWLKQCEADKSITLESARANFPRPKPPESSFNLADFLHDEYLRLMALLDEAETDADIDALKRLAEAVDCERAKLIQAVTL